MCDVNHMYSYIQYLSCCINPLISHFQPFEGIIFPPHHADFAAEDRTSLLPLLFPCAALKRETLPATLQAAGMRLNCLTCYETVAHSGIRENLEALRDKKVGVWCFYVLRH